MDWVAQGGCEAISCLNLVPSLDGLLPSKPVDHSAK